MSRIIVIFAVVVVLVPVLFEVRFDPQFALPRSVERPDAEQEARFRQCVADQTNEATRRAFEAADNPDVQSLMIRMRQKEALAECREAFPQLLVEVEEPLRIKILDLEWRFSGRFSGHP